MEVLKPVAKSTFPFDVFKIIASHSTPNELICWSHLCRKFRQEVAKPTYWNHFAKLKQLKDAKKPLLEYIQLVFDNLRYIEDIDNVELLPIFDKAKALQFVISFSDLNARPPNNRVNTLFSAFKRQLVSDAMNQVRHDQSPLIYAECLEIMGEVGSFSSLWIDHMLSAYLSSVDMSSMDPFVYFMGKTFHSDKFEIFLTQCSLYIQRYTEQIHACFPKSSFVVTWEQMVQRFHAEVLFRLINYLCESETDFVAPIFICLQPYFANLRSLCLDSKRNFGELLAPWVEKFIGTKSSQFQESAKQTIESWNKKLDESVQETERFLWSNVTRTDDKTNFLSTFKKALWVDTQKTEEKIESLNSPTTEMEAQLALLLRKVEGIQSLLNLEMVMTLIDQVRFVFNQLRNFSQALEGDVEVAAKQEMIALYSDVLDIVGFQHTQDGFNKAIEILQLYDPKKYRSLVVKEDGETAVEPLALFAELINVGDLIQQTLHLFFQQELVAYRLVDPTDFVSPIVNRKRKFEQLLDEKVAEGLNRGVDVLMDQVDFILVTEQLASDFNPFPGTVAEIGPTAAAKDVVQLIQTHINLLQKSLEKYVLEVFQQEIGMRLWNSLAKHIKRNTVSIEGAITLISDINYYHAFILGLKQRSLYPYYEALKQVTQLYLISPQDGKQLGTAISDMNRFKGVLPSDELVEFMRRRSDWQLVKGKVEKVLYGFGECCVQ